MVGVRKMEPPTVIPGTSPCVWEDLSKLETEALTAQTKEKQTSKGGGRTVITSLSTSVESNVNNARLDPSQVIVPAHVLNSMVAT